MANAYDGNGDYSNYAEEESEYGKQRKMAASGPHNGDNNHGDHLHGPNASMTSGENNYLNEKANDYMRDCLSEKSRMDRKFPIAEKLLDSEIEKVQTTGRLPSREQKYADIYREKPLRVSQKVLVPIREHPKFNFVGKLLGPKGNSLRRLQEETMCKMTVLGRNSMRDRVKEEELRNSKDPKYSHLNSDLHVEISTVAPPAEAYARVAYAMAELRKYLIPDSNDVIRQEQLRELMDSTHISDEQKSLNFNKKVASYQPGTSSSVGILTGGPNTIVAPLGPSCSNPLTNPSKSTTPYRSSSQNAVGPASATVSSYNKSNIAPKQKVMSILEKARSAMEETYGRGYEDNPPYDHHQTPHTYDTYATYPTLAPQPATGHNPHAPQTTGIGIGILNSARAPYEAVDYDANDYNRRDYYQNPTSAATPNYGASGIQPPNNGGINPNQNQNRSHVNSSTFKANNSIVSAFQAIQTQSTALAINSVGDAEVTLTKKQDTIPFLRTMTIPSKNFPPSLTQTQPVSSTKNKIASKETLYNVSADFVNENNTCSNNSSPKTSVIALNYQHHNINGNNTETTTNQLSSATASLLFVRSKLIISPAIFISVSLFYIILIHTFCFLLHSHPNITVKSSEINQQNQLPHTFTNNTSQ